MVYVSLICHRAMTATLEGLHEADICLLRLERAARCLLRDKAINVPRMLSFTSETKYKMRAFYTFSRKIPFPCN